VLKADRVSGKSTARISGIHTKPFEFSKDDFFQRDSATDRIAALEKEIIKLKKGMADD